MGLGAFPASDKQSIGMLGMHGTYEANMGMHQCDVLIAIGARFDDRVTGEIASFCPTWLLMYLSLVMYRKCLKRCLSRFVHPAVSLTKPIWLNGGHR